MRFEDAAVNGAVRKERPLPDEVATRSHLSKVDPRGLAARRETGYTPWSEINPRLWSSTA